MLRVLSWTATQTPFGPGENYLRHGTQSPSGQMRLDVRVRLQRLRMLDTRITQISSAEEAGLCPPLKTSQDRFLTLQVRCMLVRAAQVSSDL